MLFRSCFQGMRTPGLDETASTIATILFPDSSSRKGGAPPGTCVKRVPLAMCAALISCTRERKASSTLACEVGKVSSTVSTSGRMCAGRSARYWTPFRTFSYVVVAVRNEVEHPSHA